MLKNVSVVIMKTTIADLEQMNNSNVIFRGIVGSRAYGTANANSDTDERGVFFVPAKEYVRLLAPPHQINDEHNDKVYYSLLRFCQLASEANPTMLEMLFLPSDCIIKSSKAWDLLVRNRSMFITQRAVDSHLGYAISQIKKARGCNKRVWNPYPKEPPAPEDYCMLMSNMTSNPMPLEKSNIDLQKCKAAPLSRSVSADIYSLYAMDEITGGIFKNGSLVISDVPKNERENRCGILFFNKQAFEQAKKYHKEYWEWRRNRNESRWVLQEKHELDYDAKNMMHLTRLLLSGENIVKYGEPIVRFSGEKLDLLLSIRQGKWSFDMIMEHAKKIQLEIELRRECLPIACDKSRVDEIIAEIMSEYD